MYIYNFAAQELTSSGYWKTESLRTTQRVSVTFGDHLVKPLPKSTVSYTKLHTAVPSHLRSISKDEDGQSPTDSLDIFF